ncbi:nucleotide sugar dehydrogenase [Candidatus Peregrinibacteria bacterium]|mgnify:CR=1 FL=1|jgi:UDP-N-acetyl-D-glucosamine dehydrogenase|nr:nucleotide sugar dehydrogenase [Candidatus Peregrinibacteria bacterium]
MKVAVIGLGYVGFPLACAIAKNSKNEVVGFDLSEEKIDFIQNGKAPIEDEQAEKDIKEVSFEVSLDDSILEGADIFIVCVPTPITDGYLPDLGPVKGATKTCAKYLKKGSIVVIESTINPGICDDIVAPLLEFETRMKAGVDFDIAHCPERINPGDPKWNVYNIPRNVGATTLEGCKRTADFYRSFLDAEVNEMATLKEAEATKIIENTFRDINIAYVNELAQSFDAMGIDLQNVIKGASNKPFAFMPHFPGCGVGGHCIPVDPYYLIEKARHIGFDHRFLRTAREINNSMPAYTIKVLEKILTEKNKVIKEMVVGVLGVAYKPDIGDKRESPALKIISILEEKAKAVEVFDPYCLDDSTVQSIDELLEKADAIVLATGHSDFKQLTVDDFEKHNISCLVDGKNIWDKKSFENSLIIYKGIGRG